MWFPNRSDTNRPVQAQKRARSLKFRITAKLICVFVFAYADCWFSNEGAQFRLPHITSQSHKRSHFKLFHATILWSILGEWNFKIVFQMFSVKMILFSLYSIGFVCIVLYKPIASLEVSADLIWCQSLSLPTFIR